MPRLSTYFTLEEMVFSNEGERHNVDNTPNITQIFHLTRLCNEVLDPLREALNRPIHVSSGFRSSELNALLNGSKNSQHMEGKAADISVWGLTTEQLYQFIRHSNIRYDQLIQEFNRWVHISYSPDAENRMQCLRAIKENGKTKYIPG